MRLEWKRLVGVAVTSVMAVSMLGACGSSNSSSSSSNDGKTITIFNSKSEIQKQMKAMAKEYTEETGVNVEVYYSSDTVASHLATKYAANDPYTISMVDAKDVYSLKSHALDLSDQSWVDNTDYAIKVNGKTLGFPVSIEARGLIYNADAIEKITGETFDPSKYETLDEFKALLAELKAGGMTSPTGVLKEDWSLGAHFLAQVYEEQSDPDAFIAKLQKGTVNLNSNAKWTSLMNTFDVLVDNNYAKSNAVSAERETTEQKLAKGEIAFMFGGNWDWAVLNQYDPSDNMGIMAVPQNTTDGTNTKLVGGGSKYFIIDNSSNTSATQRKEAKAFLKWLAEDSEGQDFLVNDCSIVSPFKNVTLEPSDPLGKSVKSYADAGNLIANYNYLPDDHYSVLGAAFQKYLAGQEDRAALATEITTYWKTAKLSK